MKEEKIFVMLSGDGNIGGICIVRFNWDELPENANYVAIDNDGNVSWFERVPYTVNNYWMSDGLGTGHVKYLSYEVENWKTTLRKRPKMEESILLIKPNKSIIDGMQWIKFNWNDLPDLANYVAVDRDGAMWWYEKKPFLSNTCWISTGFKAGSIKNLSYEVENWKTTLRKRPNGERNTLQKNVIVSWSTEQFTEHLEDLLIFE